LHSDLPEAHIEETVFLNANSDYEVYTPSPASSQELIESAQSTDALMVQYSEIDRNVISSLPNLKVISRYGIGVDCIDLDAANEFNIAVTNVPSYCEEEVATHTLALILNGIRKLNIYNSEVRNDSWGWKNNKPIYSLNDTTLGFVGFGKIPKKIVDFTEGFNFDYLTFDPNLQKEVIEKYPIEQVGWKQLLLRSDIISVHCPLNADTKNKFDKEAFKLMKSNSLIINTARGGIVNEPALVWAIKNEQIAGAGIDVMNTEPPQSSPLFQYENVVVTPHMAWYSESSLENLRIKTAENIVLYFEGKDPHGFVNRQNIVSKNYR
jgi:D-3-phosphoglycerate dehydrogenase